MAAANSPVTLEQVLHNRRRLQDIGSEYVPDGPDCFLGSGSFGTVRRMRRVKDGKLFAVKRIEKVNLRSASAVCRLGVELLVGEQLDSPLVPRLQCAVHTKGSVYVVFDLCDGVSLSRLLKMRGGVLPPQEAAYVLQQLFTALCHCHSCGVVHRDVKPENIVVNPSTLQLWLVDFGLAKCFPVKQTNGRPLSNRSDVSSPLFPTTPCGTLGYVALEMMSGYLDSKAGWWGCKASDLPKLDVWAVGATAWRCLFGKLPWAPPAERKKPEDFQQRLRRIEQIVLSTEVPTDINVPEPARNTVVQLLSSDPRRRPSAEQALWIPWLSNAQPPGPAVGARATAPAQRPCEPLAPAGLSAEKAAAVPSESGSSCSTFPMSPLDLTAPLPAAVLSRQLLQDAGGLRCAGRLSAEEHACLVLALSQAVRQ
eukprot:TRINITY_DN3788_c0_g1_i1.p1 TRINITY_DN3788_c0_g1~~TRINITY_DN3788_c0_g1_i1.p1  ORF type:complete len:423 (+),score=61.52 TRINITY_DN3788_c0_g1_i1:73-1341(+)